MQQQFLKKIVVIYHGGCSDGFGGAWAARKKFGDRAHYYGASHGEPPLDYLRNKEIYLIDFNYSPEVIAKLIKNNLRVTALDHHVTTEKSTKMTQDYRYAVNNSGCVLAWKYFHPKKPAPRFLLNIEEMDLWKFKLGGAKELRALLETYDMNFKIWDNLARSWEKGPSRKRLVEQGELLLRYQYKRISNLIGESAQNIKLAGHAAVAVNSPFLEDFTADALLQHGAHVVVVWRVRKNQLRFSLRSDGTVDVSKIAVKFGGGGHKVSSGFSLPLGAKLPWSVVAGKKQS